MQKKSFWKNGSIYLVLAAMVVIAVLILPLFATPPDDSGVKKVLAAAPEPVGEGLSAADFIRNDAYLKWSNDYSGKLRKAGGLSESTLAYSSALMQKVLTGRDENAVCSPLNTWFAFAMLAETCDGNSRKQLLDMLGTESMESLRETAAALWDANALQTPMITSLLADSLWLNDHGNFREETLKTLAGQYHASSFRGTPGSGEMDKALQDWTNEATGGLLDEYVKDLKLSPDTVLALLSALYYKAEWEKSFDVKLTVPQTFHGTKGDTEVRMMKQDTDSYLLSDSFTAVRLGLKESGAMYCFLPKEGADADTILSDPNVLKAATDPESPLWVNEGAALYLPRFKVQAKTDLLPVMKALGATDVLGGSKADFTPLLPDSSGLFVSRAEHAASVEIDEEGLTGAAYTLIELYQGLPAPNTVDIIFDRPFLFVVTSADGSILFAGVVRNISE